METEDTNKQYYCKPCDNENKITPTWIIDNVGETTDEEIKETITSAGGTIASLTHLEKGGITLKLDEKHAVDTMCNLKDWFARKK